MWFMSVHLLFVQILSFYQRMGMALPEKPPLMMVESSALNDAEEREGRSGGGHSHSHGPVFHTRGLTLTVEYRAIQQVVTRDGRRFTQPVDLSNRDRFEVSFTQHSSTSSCLRSNPIAAAFVQNLHVHGVLIMRLALLHALHLLIVIASAESGFSSFWIKLMWVCSGDSHSGVVWPAMAVDWHHSGP